MNNNMPETTQFGRLQSDDPRDFEHIMEGPLRSYLVPSRIWSAGPTTNQGSQPHCVGHTWRQILEASPVRKGSRTLPSPDAIYHAAQKIDEWPGPPPRYDGTSVRAGAKVLMSLGLISEYVWAPNVDVLRKYVLGRGPVAIGTMWYSNMSTPEMRGGDAWLNPSGDSEGGHAYVIIGYSRTRHAFRIINSWGTQWAESGRAWVHVDVMEQLVFMQSGEACSALEVE